MLPGAVVFFATWLTAFGRPASQPLLAAPGLTSAQEVVLTLAVATGSALAVRAAPVRPWPLFAVAGVAGVAFGTWPALGAASYFAAAVFRRRSHLVLYMLAAGAVVALPGVAGAVSGAYTFSWGDLPGAGATYALFVMLPLVAGLWVGARGQIHAARHAHAQERARAQERTRIAREMHDVVAHRVSLIVLQAGALQVNARDEDVAAEAAQIRATGREALAELREVLGVLRSPGAEAGVDPPSGLDGLDRLLDRSRSAGLPVRRGDEGTARPLPAVVERTAYHVVREALTNVHKHAGTVSTDVVLRHLPSALTVTVRNAAPQAPPLPVPGSGLGLVGLRERIELLGGELDARPHRDGGFTLFALLPVPPPGAEETADVGGLRGTAGDGETT